MSNKYIFLDLPFSTAVNYSIPTSSVLIWLSLALSVPFPILLQVEIELHWNITIIKPNISRWRHSNGFPFRNLFSNDK